MSRPGPRDVRSRIRHQNTHLGEGTEYRQPTSNPAQQQQQQHAHQYQPQQQYQYGSNGYDAYAQQQQGYAHHQQSASIGQYGAAGHGSTSYSQAPSSSQQSGERPSYEAGVYGGTNDSNAASASGPLRPARSVRRPLQPPALEPHHQARAPHSDNSRSNSRPRDAAYHRLQGNDQSENDSSGHGHGDLNQYDHYEMEEEPAAPAAPVGSLTSPKSPHLLNSAVSALSAAARKQQANRVMRGTTAEEETQRRRNERKIHDMRDVQARPVEHYMSRNDEGNFRYINAVLRKAKAEWPLFGEDEFNHVAMALSLLDSSSLGSSYETFNQMKVTLEDSLQGTVDDHYESFATAITNHNSVLSALSSAQAGVQQAAKRLRDSREALGVRRADLVQMWQRAQSVKEAIDLLDILDSLRAVPEHLETLIAEKRFLQAVNLLNRALKTIAKPEIEEIGASSDLRAYLKGQETAILDILIEELHNHLYLKSAACDVRWKAYVPGQEKLPEVEFGIDLEKLDTGAASERQAGSSDGPDKLTRYLHALEQHPNFSAAPENDFADLALPQSASMSSTFPVNDVPGSAALTASKSMDSTFSLTAGSNDGHTFFDSDDVLDRYEQNPEMDSFLYIEMILESLAKLGNLGFALEVVTQRLPIELHALVDTTIEQVDQRNTALRPFSLALRPESLILSSSLALARSFATDPLGKTDSFRSSFSNIGGDRPLSTLMRMTAVESSALHRDTETMRDVFWTLFSKMDAVLQGHRVLFEVVSRILQRPPSRNQPDLRDVRLGSLMDVWKPIESEVRMLLHDHLLDESQSSSAARNASISVNEVLRDSKFGRDRSKKLFKLADSNTKAAKSDSLKLLRKHEDALTNTLRDSLPVLMGTAAGNGQGTNASSSQSASILDNAQVHQHIIISSIRSESQQHTGMGHRLLVKPDAFNVSVLFQPTLAFLNRVEAVIPADSKTQKPVKFGGFVDEFVQRIFLPQLEDRVQSLLATATGGLDAFQEDPASRQIARKPIVKSVGNVIVLIDSLYSMLRATPFHRESYSRLIIQTIAQYYQRCNGRFKEIASADHDTVARTDAPQSPYVLSATWAQKPELKACLVERLQLEPGSDRITELQAQENRFEMLYAQQAGGIRFTDLITSRKKLTGLANLHHSLRFFIEHTSRLKATESYKGTAVQNPTARLSIMGRSGVKSATDALQLPMNQDMARRFEALPETFRNFGNTILFTLRLELRARAIHFIDLALHEGTYLVDSGTLEPDSHVVDLNVELASCDDILIQTLAPEQHSFLFNGLASLMDSLLISGVRRVRAMNKHGATKMMRNIMALQQNLKNIVEDPLEVDFEHSRRFWELLMKEPDQYMDAIKAMSTRHSFEEYKSALHLMLGLENASSAASSSQGPVPSSFAGAGILGSGSRDVSRQKYNEYLIELHEIVADISE